MYKIRSPLYINIGKQFYFGRVDFIDDLYISELHYGEEKRLYNDPPHGISDTGGGELWEELRLRRQRSFVPISFAPVYLPMKHS